MAANDLARAMRCTRAVERAEVSGRVALEATALRSRSLESLDVALALATSGRECDYLAWSQRVTTATRAGRGIGDELDPQWAATLAQILARLIFEPSAEAIALDIYRELAARFGPESLEPKDAQVYGQLLLHSEEHEDLRSALPHLDLRPVIRRMLLTDLQRAEVTLGRSPLSDWASRLQELMQGDSPGFELPEDTNPFSFDRLISQTGAPLVDGPLITVVMPVFAPDAGLGTAVRSILNQTWQNIELLVVDDASPEPTRHLFEEVAALDERVRVVTRPRNGGTYSARNTALALARGSFVTGQDADDWSHPERLQRQVGPLLEDRSLVATLSRSLRVTDDLRASSLRASGSSPMRMNSSSPLFRRSEVMHRMGYYDKVRKSGDSEFIFRMRAVFGELAVRELPDCLALVRLTSGSLSRADFLPGWQHESRVWYRELFRNWHRRIRGGADPFLAIDQRERPFAAPAGVVSRGAGVLEVDDLFIADLRNSQSSHEHLLCVVRQLCKQGRRVGLAHLERFDTLQSVRHGLSPAILNGLSEGEFELVEWSREVNAEHIMVWPAELTEFHGERRVRWRSARVSLVIEDRLPLSEVSAALLGWQASASWVARNLRGEDRIGLIAPVVRGPATEPNAGEHGPLQQVGLIGCSTGRREVVLVESADDPTSATRLASAVEALTRHGISFRLAGLSWAGDALAPSQAVGAGGRPVELWGPDAEGDGVSVFVAVADGQRGSEVTAEARTERCSLKHTSLVEREDSSRDSVCLVPTAMPDAGVWPPSHPDTVSEPEAQQRWRHHVVRGAEALHPLPFIAIAGELGPKEVRDWSSYTLDGVEYWFPRDGTAVVAPLRMHHRLRTPDCVVAVGRGVGGVRDIRNEWSQSKIVDPASALNALSAARAPAALAVHDSHLWTVYSTAPTGLLIARDRAGHLCAVATEEALLAAFLAALRGVESSGGGPPGDADGVGRLLLADWRPVGSGWVRGGAVAFSALHGHAFAPLAQLTLAPAS